MEAVGAIHGEVKSTTFTILLSKPGVERGSYVKIKHDIYGWVLARIDSMKRYLDEFEDEINIANAHTVGYMQENSILIPKTPFKPEEKVYMADKSLIIDILGLSSRREGNIYLGRLEGHDISVYLNVKKTIGKHTSVLAKTGAGKSYTVAVMLEELMKDGIPIVIVDPHGEYSSLKVENDEYDEMLKCEVKAASYADRITEYATNLEVNPNAVRMSLNPSFDMMELSNIMPVQLSDTQKSLLYESLKRLEGTEYTLGDLIKDVSGSPSKAKWKVVSGLETLAESGAFVGTPVTAQELVVKNRASIVNLRGTDPGIQQLVVAKVVRDLFDARRLGKIPEFFFLIEEAHNFCPERGYGGNVISSNVIRDVASEGRKFGFFLCVVSQRPARVDKNVLSQCSTQIILKVTNPNDLRAIGQSIEGFTSGMEAEIKQLSIGHALVVGECVEQPITVDIRVRETKHFSSTPPLKVEEKVDEGEKKVEKLPKPKKKGFLNMLRRIFLKE
ncbi:MAG: ATP-binding protein [Candidatus Altiarchaeota archaeon]